MKSVIKKPTHYSLLLMRDDTEVRNYRVHSRTLRFFVWSFLLLLAGGVAGVYGGYHFWEKSRTLASRYDAQDREVSEMKLQLERLIALETVLAASNGAIPQARHTEIGAGQSYAAARNGTQAPPDDTPAASAAAAQGSDVAASGTAGSEASGSGTPGAGTDSATTVALDATKQAAQAGDAPAPDGVAQAREPAYPQISSAESPLRVNALNVRVTGQQRLGIRHELVTEGNIEQRMISGSVRYFVIFADGSRVETSVSNTAESRFSIARMRTMQNTLVLPQGYRAADVEEFDILIELSDGKRFEERFDLNISR